MSCGRRRLGSCPARLRLVGWAAPGGAAHVVYRGYPGSCPPHNFHTCCTMCIHMLQCNFPHVSFTPLHMLQCHFLHVLVTLFLHCAIIVYAYICCNFLCLTLHILFYCSPFLKNTKFYWRSIILWWRKILMSLRG